MVNQSTSLRTILPQTGVGLNETPKTNSLDLLASIVEQERKKLVQFSYWILHDKNDAEDMVQKAFLKLTPRAALGRTITRPFVYVTVHNLSIDEFHKRERHVLRDPSDPFWELLPTRKKGCDHYLTARQEELVRLSQQLPPLQRYDFLSRTIRERAFEEIAHETGRNETAVRKSVSKADKKVTALFCRGLLLEGDYSQLSFIHIDLSLLQEVAKCCQGEDKVLDQLYQSFGYPNLTKCIRNIAWVLRFFFKEGTKEANVIGDFLLTHIRSGELSILSQVEVAEALLDLDHARYSKAIQEHLGIPEKVIQEREVFEMMMNERTDRQPEWIYINRRAKKSNPKRRQANRRGA